MIILTWKWTKNLAIKFQFIWLNHPRSGPKPPSSRQGLARQLFFCAAFTSYYEENDRGQTITAKKTTKSLISNQKTQEYIKSKCPLFIL